MIFSHLDDRAHRPCLTAAGSEGSRRRPWRRRARRRPSSIDAGDAVARAVGAAVEAGDRPQVAVEPDDAARRSGSATRACGCPWCGRRRIAAARGSCAPDDERRGDPVARAAPRASCRRDSRPPQHEFDQPVARREQRQPGAAVGSRRQPRGIAGQLGEHRLGGHRCGRRPEEPMPPAFGDDQPLRRRHATPIGKGEARREAGGVAAAADRRSRPSRRRPSRIRSRPSRTARCRREPLQTKRSPPRPEGQRGRAGQTVRHGDLAVPATNSLPSSRPIAQHRPPARPRGRSRARRMLRHAPPRRRARRSSLPDVKRTRPPSRHEIVRRVDRGGHGFALVERRVRPERAVHRRDGDRLAAEQVEERSRIMRRLPQ